MPSMKNLIITNKGHELMARMIAGTAVVNFTKICTSNYDYSETVLEELLELEQIKQTTLVSSVARTNAATVQVEGAVTNSELTEGYFIRGVGLYAEDDEGTEILYAVSVSDNPDYMPPFNGSTVSGVMFKLITTVSNSSQVSLEVNPAAVATIADLQNVTSVVEVHTTASIQGEDGIHGIRFFNDKLEYFNGTDWIEIETGGGGLPPNNVSNFNVAVGNGELTISWNDPNDTVVDGQTLVTWSGTKIVRKVGAFPDDEKDGVLILDNKVRNQYASEGFVDTGLTNGVTYYYQAFPYSDQGAVNRNEVNRQSASPQPFVTYGIRIDMNNSNPETAVVYTDDAVGMTGGSIDWDTKFPFTQIKPCMLKNGIVQYYLDPTDYTKKADGTAADITSGNDGDVMIEIPKMAYMIYTQGDYIYVKVTDNPNAKAVDSRFSFYAHTRDSEGDREKLYIGAYLGHTLTSKLRSLSGKAPSHTKTISTFRTEAQANGAGYDQVSFYPLTLLQCLYAIRFKNLDSQTAIGRGYVDGNSAMVNTGGANTRGMYYGEGTGKQQMKFLGIEDFWGNLRWWIDGLFSNATRNILTAFKNFNDTGSGYTDRGQGATADLANYMSKPQGTTERGFIAKEVAGSATTYYADYANLYASRLPAFGGAWANASNAGAFYLNVSNSASDSSSSLGGRLMYL